MPTLELTKSDDDYNEVILTAKQCYYLIDEDGFVSRINGSTITPVMNLALELRELAESEDDA